MSFTKYASCEVLEVKTSNSRLPHDEVTGANLAKFARMSDHATDSDGYLYVRVRAISSRVNKNNDGWPSEELAKSYGTFKGRPIFVDHNNDDPKRTRGVIVDSKLHVDDEKTSALDPYYATAPDNHKPPTWIELLLEVDAKTYPKLAKAIEEDDIDAVSMGANIDLSVCSVCSNEATSPSQYCSHIEKKGSTFEIEADNGEKVHKKSYEDCYGVNFFEISFVFDPADETALKLSKSSKVTDDELSRISFIKEAPGDKHLPAATPKRNRQYEHILDSCKKEHPDWSLDKCKELAARTVNKQRAEKGETKSSVEDCGCEDGIEKTADMGDYGHEYMYDLKNDTAPKNQIPQDQQVTAPENVNTLRDDVLCPDPPLGCGSDELQEDPDGILRCPTCGFEQPPEPFDNPDLDAAGQEDADQAKAEQGGDEEDGVEFPEEGGSKPVEGIEPITPIKSTKSQGRISDMKWTTVRKGARVELGAGGISPDTYLAISKAGLDATITYPNGLTTNPPKDNPVKDMMAYVRLSKTSKGPVTVTVESENLDEVVDLIKSAAIKQKPKVVLPQKRPASQERVVRDQPKPVESMWKEDVLDGEYVVSYKDGKVLAMTQVEESEMENREADRRTIKRQEEELEEGGVRRLEEIVEETGNEPTAEATQEEAPQAEESEEEREYQYAASAPAEDGEKKLLAAFDLAELATSLGIVSNEEKLAFVGELEDETLAEINARKDTLLRVKSAGLQRKSPRLAGLTRVPKMNGNGPAEAPSALDDVPFEAIFNV
jgi:hypothetical protein